MSQFLLLITENKMRQALELSSEILKYEPNNRMILDYQSTLRDYIDQEGAEEDGKESDDDDHEDEDDDEEDDEDDDEEEEDDEEEKDQEDESKNESKKESREYKK